MKASSDTFQNACPLASLEEDKLVPGTWGWGGGGSIPGKQPVVPSQDCRGSDQRNSQMNVGLLRHSFSRTAQGTGRENLQLASVNEEELASPPDPRVHRAEKWQEQWQLAQLLLR